jgi:hypothetical protein
MAYRTSRQRKRQEQLRKAFKHTVMGAMMGFILGSALFLPFLLKG